MNYEIQRLAGELYQVLMECDRKEKVRQYVMGHRTNPYLNLFLIQAFEASDKGDVVQSEEVSLFSENVEHLRLELMEELYRRKRRSHEFAGYIFVSVAPFFMMPVLKQWGLDFAPELEFFYAGSGVILELVTFVVTVTIYELISRAKEIALFSEAEEEKIWNLECIYKLPFITGLVKNLERTESKFSCKVRRLL
ncbi:MAG: hypothetical protein IJ274_12020, partial [Lachnospiraceae bacterium]|nr:hypothetical protein [Lachnospiraceae bacterium]